MRGRHSAVQSASAVSTNSLSLSSTALAVLLRSAFSLCNYFMFSFNLAISVSASIPAAMSGRLSNFRPLAAGSQLAVHPSVFSELLYSWLLSRVCSQGAMQCAQIYIARVTIACSHSQCSPLRYWPVTEPLLSFLFGGICFRQLCCVQDVDFYWQQSPF